MKIPSKFSNKEILLALSLVGGIGDVTLRKLFKNNNNPNFNILSKDLVNKIKHFDWNDFGTRLKEYDAKNIECLPFWHELYPVCLREINDFPPFIFCKGNLQLLKNTPRFAIVGTRKISSYGKRCVEKFIPEFVNKGWCIVSGMAFGVDSYSQKVTLANSGKTIAVLASGVDIPSPMSNSQLYKMILEKDGLIISEQLPGTEPLPGFFPRRNRIISGLSRGVLIVEAGKKSGSLITAYSAFEQNREVFAIPGDLGKTGSVGTNKIISEDIAKLVIAPIDILQSFGYLEKDKKKESVSCSLTFEDEVQKNIYEEISNKGALSMDDLVRLLKFDIMVISNALTMMELKGILTTVDSKYMISL